MDPPAHHLRDGRFRNPWPEAAGDEALRKRIREVAWEWFTKPMPPDPDPKSLPVAIPDLAVPRVADGEVRITWAGHASFLLQLPGLNLLTDPMWSARASPISLVGTKRFVAARPSLDELPPIDGVLLSHDHFDHLDRPTVRALLRRFGDSVTWYTPLGYRSWFAGLGVGRVVELDWWQDVELPGTGHRIVAAPARHWTRRTPWGTNRRLWCSFAVLPPDPSGFRLYFGGDSGHGAFFREIGSRLGPFQASILPIGAYDPRWFMAAAHMSPEEAVDAYLQLGGEGAFVASHWGTFRLTFEDPLEPPVRALAAWEGAGLPPERLALLRHGQTLLLES